MLSKIGEWFVDIKILLLKGDWLVSFENCFFFY